LSRLGPSSVLQFCPSGHTWCRDYLAPHRSPSCFLYRHSLIYLTAPHLGIMFRGYLRHLPAELDSFVACWDIQLLPLLRPPAVLRLLSEFQFLFYLVYYVIERFRRSLSGESPFTVVSLAHTFSYFRDVPASSKPLFVIFCVQSMCDQRPTPYRLRDLASFMLSHSASGDTAPQRV